MEWRHHHARDRSELGEARQIQHGRELHAVCRWRLLRFRSDQEEGQHRIELSRARVKIARQDPVTSPARSPELCHRKLSTKNNDCITAVTRRRYQPVGGLKGRLKCSRSSRAPSGCSLHCWSYRRPVPCSRDHGQGTRLTPPIIWLSTTTAATAISFWCFGWRRR